MPRSRCNGEAVDGELRWWIDDKGSRLWVGGTKEKPTVAKPDDAPDNDGKDYTPVVLNGVLFYPVGHKAAGRVITTTVAAHKRQWARSSSPSKGVIPKDTDVTANYWCLGEQVEDEAIWWILGKDINAAPRLWSGATASRPH
jgi:hypothetical protein